MKKSLQIFLVSILFIGALLTPVFAVGDNTIRENIGENISLRCDNITNRIELIILKYNNNKDRHIERYKNISQTLSELITTLESNGYDVKQLQEDVDQLNVYIKEFTTEYSKFIEQLELSQEYACANSEGDFRRTVENARSYLLQARETALDIRILINDEIRTDLEDLKN